MKIYSNNENEHLEYKGHKIMSTKNTETGHYMSSADAHKAYSRYWSTSGRSRTKKQDEMISRYRNEKNSVNVTRIISDIILVTLLLFIAGSITVAVAHRNGTINVEVPSYIVSIEDGLDTLMQSSDDISTVTE